MGYLTPPVGINLFVASYRFKEPILGVTAAALMLGVLASRPAHHLPAVDDDRAPRGVRENVVTLGKLRMSSVGGRDMAENGRMTTSCLTRVGSEKPQPDESWDEHYRDERDAAYMYRAMAATEGER